MNEMNETESEARSTAETERPAEVTRLTGIKGFLAKSVTSISINDTDIKLTVFKGNEIKKWVTCPLESGVVVNGIVQDSYSLSETLKSLFRDNNVNTSNLIFGLSGLHAITRIITLPRVSQRVLREAIIYEAERELPVPIDSIYLFWQTIESDSHEMKVFLIAYAQNTVDALLETLRKAGIKPHLLELAPLAIARCVNSPTSIVFDVRPGELDIVVTIDNIPELIRSVPLPPYNFIDENLPMILPIVLDELQRTITFCKSSRSIEDLPIFGFGDLNSEIFESLSTALNHPITLSCPPLIYPSEFSPDTCSVNLGLALGKVKISGYEHSRRVNINLLPEVYKGKLVTQKGLVAAGATVAVGILAAIFVMYLLTAVDANSIRNDLESAKLEQSEKQDELMVLGNEVNDLTAKKAQAASLYNKLTNSLKILKADQASINDDLIDLRKPILMELQPGLYSLDLSSKIDNTSLTLGGEDSRDNILAYVRYLEDSGLFSSIVLNIDGNDYTLSLQKGE